jgi:hypothetical protein
MHSEELLQLRRLQLLESSFLVLLLIFGQVMLYEAFCVRLVYGCF